MKKILMIATMALLIGSAGALAGCASRGGCAAGGCGTSCQGCAPDRNCCDGCRQGTGCTCVR